MHTTLETMLEEGRIALPKKKFQENLKVLLYSQTFYLKKVKAG